jgi:hypothetical protein
LPPDGRNRVPDALPRSYSASAPANAASTISAARASVLLNRCA